MAIEIEEKFQVKAPIEVVWSFISEILPQCGIRSSRLRDRQCALQSDS